MFISGISVYRLSRYFICTLWLISMFCFTQILHKANFYRLAAVQCSAAAAPGKPFILFLSILPKAACRYSTGAGVP